MEKTGTKFFYLENFVTNCDHLADYFTKFHPFWMEFFYLNRGIQSLTSFDTLYAFVIIEFSTKYCNPELVAYVF